MCLFYTVGTKAHVKYFVQDQLSREAVNTAVLRSKDALQLKHQVSLEQ